MSTAKRTVTVTLDAALVQEFKDASDAYRNPREEPIFVRATRMAEARERLAAHVVDVVAAMPHDETSMGPIETTILVAPGRYGRAGTFALPPARAGALAAVPNFERTLIAHARSIVPARDQAFHALLEGPFEYARIAYDGGSPVGVIGYDPAARPQLLIYVLPLFRRRGIGTLLVENALRHYLSPIVWMGSADAHGFWSRFAGKVRNA